MSAMLRLTLAVVASLCGLSGAIAEDAVSAVLKMRVEELTAGQELRVQGELIAARKLLSQLYRRREFRPAWLRPDRQAQLLALVEASRDHGLDPSDYHADALRKGRADGPDEARDLADRDLLFTDALVRLVYHLHFGKTNPRRLYADWSFSRPLGPIEPVQALEALLAGERLVEAVESHAPQLSLYRDLRQALAQHRTIEASGGWGTVPAGGTLKPGMRDPRVQALRARLAASVDLSWQPTGDPELFDEALETAVQRFQMRHRLEPDAAVGARTVQALNVDVAWRVEQIRVNLERLRWFGQDFKDDHLLVDVAGYSARLYLDAEVAWSSRVVVGRPYRRTPAFRATMQSITLNPAWSVPPTILREDVLPRIIKDRRYLDENHMHVVDQSGRRISPSAIEWERYRASPFPYRIVQDPGPANPLGQIRFNLPNPYGVCLHDTPAKELFERTQRAFSSGCIRLEKPHELAILLLDDTQHWNAETLRAEIATGETRTLPIKRRVPVMALYLTAEAEEDGTTYFRPNLYAQDAKVAAALATPFRAVKATSPRARGPQPGVALARAGSHRPSHAGRAA
jgi:murein L,D-transpeptidase YcbB/YkuD